jgi:outer membrane protein TolC
MQIALRNNEKIKIALEEMMLARMKVDDARRGLWPKMLIKEEETGGKTTADFVGRHASAEVQVPLYTGGKLRNTLRQSRINLAVALMNFKRERERIRRGPGRGVFLAGFRQGARGDQNPARQGRRRRP